MDQDYLRESRIAAAGELGSYAQLRERYNATVTLYGNMLFYPGQYIYINPQFFADEPLPALDSITTLIGLGGYYLITKVENTIEQGKGGFETILSCNWVYSGFRERRNMEGMNDLFRQGLQALQAGQILSRARDHGARIEAHRSDVERVVEEAEAE